MGMLLPISKPSPATPLLPVVVKDVLDEARLATVRAGVERVVREIIARDPDRLGNRGSHRYSIGSAAEAFGETAAWSALVDPPPLLEVMAAVFGDEELQCGGCTGGECVQLALWSRLHVVSSAFSSAFPPQQLPASRLLILRCWSAASACQGRWTSSISTPTARRRRAVGTGT